MTWINIDTNANTNLTYDASFGATVNKATNAIYLAYAADVNTLGTDDDIRTASYNGAVWTAKTNVLTNDARGVTGVKIGTKENTEAIFVLYTAQTTAGVPNSANVYYKLSTDGMTTFGSEPGPVNASPGDMYGARVNIDSDERIYATWVDGSVADLYGNTVADLSATGVDLADFTATRVDSGILLRWRTGFEVRNLGFNVYRQQHDRRLLLNPSIIAGSAFVVGPGATMSAGNSYEWLDPEGAGDSVYYLEDLDLDGTSTVHGAVQVSSELLNQPSAGKRPWYERPLMLDELGNQSGKQDRNWQKSWATRLATESSRESSLFTSRDNGVRGSTQAGLLNPVRLSTSLQPSLVMEKSENLNPFEQQQMLAARPAVKLAIRSEGWYRVSRAELLAAGMDPSADSRHLQLFADGTQVPIKINSSSSSGPLRDGDSIEFYAVGLDTPSTDIHQYWLITATSEGDRIDTQNLNVAGPIGGLRSFDYNVELKERRIYFSGLLNGESENFFGPVVNTAPVNQTLSISHLDSNNPKPAELEVALQGATLQDQLITVSVNAKEVGNISFYGLVHKLVQFQLAPEILRDGENTITLSRTSGVSLVDYVRLSYSHTYEADNDRLEFTVRGRARVSGFSVPAIMLLDITNPRAVSVHYPKIEKELSGYAFAVNTPDTRTFLALPRQSAQQPAAISSNQPSSWSAANQSGDLVIIAPRAFMSSVEPLAQLRRSQGLSVAVVDIEDVYDEFSFGAHTSQAIRDFLEWASSKWIKPPRFVLLAGDGSYDPRNYLGSAETDLVPVRLIDTAALETVSDDWFIDFNSETAAAISIGRLPARNAGELATMISKIVNYSPSHAAQKALMVADTTDDKTNFDFESATNDLAMLLSSTVGSQKIFRADNPTSVVHDQIVDAINQGPLIVNYMGHGSVEVWTGAPILSTADEGAYQNGPRLPVFLIMTCLNGYYQNPARESLAESLLRSNTGGAVAVWASSGMTEPRPQFDVSRNLYQQLFGAESMTLGQAVRRAKIVSADRDVSRTWIFFGDPSMSIR